MGERRATALLWGGVVSVVAVVTVLATWIPARRAGRLDPTEALRAD